jgi:hypothetical protein
VAVPVWVCPCVRGAACCALFSSCVINISEEKLDIIHVITS